MPRQYPCHLCDKVLTRSNILGAHLKGTHYKVKEHQCDQCETQRTRAWDLKQHKLEVHGGEGKFKCMTCDYESHRKHDLQRHYDRNGGSECGPRSQVQDNLDLPTDVVDEEQGQRLRQIVLQVTRSLGKVPYDNIHSRMTYCQWQIITHMVARLYELSETETQLTNAEIRALWQNTKRGDLVAARCIDVDSQTLHQFTRLVRPIVGWKRHETTDPVVLEWLMDSKRTIKSRCHD